MGVCHDVPWVNGPHFDQTGKLWPLVEGDLKGEKFFFIFKIKKMRKCKGLKESGPVKSGKFNGKITVV